MKIESKQPANMNPQITNVICLSHCVQKHLNKHPVTKDNQHSKYISRDTVEMSQLSQHLTLIYIKYNTATGHYTLYSYKYK